jgi:hypothetical protein
MLRCEPAAPTIAVRPDKQISLLALIPVHARAGPETRSWRRCTVRCLRARRSVGACGPVPAELRVTHSVAGHQTCGLRRSTDPNF